MDRDILRLSLTNRAANLCYINRTVMLSYPSLESATARDRILIVAPHIDDETIGAGGYAIDAARRGAELYLVFLTAGDCARFAAHLMNRKIDPTPSDYLALGHARIEEAREVMRILGVPRHRWFVLGYPDRGLQAMLARATATVRSVATGLMTVPYEEALSPGAEHTLPNLIADLQKILEICRPTTVIAPVSFDMHPDHSATAEIVDRALEESTATPNRLGYLVHSSMLKPLFWQPDRAVVPPPALQSYAWTTYDLSAEVQHIKLDMLQAYRSQRPYTILLRNAFVRSNELFFAYAPISVQVEHAALVACAPCSQQSSY